VGFSLPPLKMCFAVTTPPSPKKNRFRGSKRSSFHAVWLFAFPSGGGIYARSMNYSDECVGAKNKCFKAGTGSHNDADGSEVEGVLEGCGTFSMSDTAKSWRVR